MGQVRIQENTLNLTFGRTGKIAVLMYAGNEDPVLKLDEAVAQYVGNEESIQFIDINMDNPWVRVVISGINEMEQLDFDPSIHRI